MPRAKRVQTGGMVYFVRNRVTFNRFLFMTEGDHAAFLRAVVDATEQTPMRVIAFCMLLQEWSLVLWPREDGDMARFMHRLTTTHATRWNACHMSLGDGHLYHDRYRSFPIQPGAPILKICRYVEQGGARAGYAERPENWRWSSAGYRPNDPHDPVVVLDPGPTPRPDDWRSHLASPLAPETLADVETCIKRGRPYGDTIWRERVARELGVESTLRSPGRPRKAK